MGATLDRKPENPGHKTSSTRCVIRNHAADVHEVKALPCNQNHKQALACGCDLHSGHSEVHMQSGHAGYGVLACLLLLLLDFCVHRAELKQVPGGASLYENPGVRHRVEGVR